MEGLIITGITMTPAATARIMTTAVEAGYTHGIGYWAEVKDVRREDGEIIGLLIHDREEAGMTDSVTEKFKSGAPRWITGSDIIDAVRKMFADPAGCDTTSAGKLLDDDAIDGPLCDLVMQVACFGKVIYG